jgi:hypothetical protein
VLSQLLSASFSGYLEKFKQIEQERGSDQNVQLSHGIHHSPGEGSGRDGRAHPEGMSKCRRKHSSSRDENIPTLGVCCARSKIAVWRFWWLDDRMKWTGTCASMIFDDLITIKLPDHLTTTPPSRHEFGYLERITIHNECANGF